MLFLSLIMKLFDPQRIFERSSQTFDAVSAIICVIFVEETVMVNCQ